jgi:starvation-inducible outer membrane lipoprotein
MKLKSGYRGRGEKDFRYANIDDARKMSQGSTQYIEDQHGKWRNVKITSIKTWKTRPEIEVKWKYGMWEYGSTMFYEKSVAGAAFLIET